MSGRFQRRSILGEIVGGLVLAFLVMPILAVVPASVNNASFIKIPPEAYSLRWYVQFFGDASWVSALANSVEVAVLATVLLCEVTARPM